MYRSRRFRPAWLAIVLSVVVSVIGATPAYAITGGQPDNGAHPNVGLIVDWTYGYICSGTLISEYVVLTAGHCTIGYAEDSVVEVTFDDQYSSGATFHSVASWETHYAYDDSAWPFTVDVGVLILAEPAGIAHAGLTEYTFSIASFPSMEPVTKSSPMSAMVRPGSRRAVADRLLHSRWSDASPGRITIRGRMRWSARFTAWTSCCSS